MPKRFNNLDAALKYMNPSGTDGNSSSEAPAGSQLRLYQDWKSGKRAVEYGDRPAGSEPGNLLRVTIKPFAFAAADTSLYVVDLSARAQTNYANAGLSAASLGIGTDTSNAVTVPNFSPARITVTTAPTGAATTQTSKLTGRRYKKKAVNSFTFPFGRITAEPTYAGAKAALLAGAVGATNRTATFQPEIYR